MKRRVQLASLIGLALAVSAFTAWVTWGRSTWPDSVR